MAGGRVFLVGGSDAELVPMDETPYATEDVLQELLERYPDLLAGDQINPENPRRWLLVARELGVPGEEGGGSVWSLDHLFLDQDGVPTFVECKRASDTRNRREVVAQMLDYAANGTEYWPMDRLRQTTAETARAAGSSVDEQVEELLDSDDADIEAYWQTVEHNLRSGSVRLVFVADRTPRELRRLVEFLNEKMADVEVLAVEVKQYLGDEHRVVVPRVIGLTEAARAKKSAGQRRFTSRAELLDRIEPVAAELFSYVLDEAATRGHVVKWGVSAATVGVFVENQGRSATYSCCRPTGHFEFVLEYLTKYGLADYDRVLALRKQVLATGEFQEAGKYTLRALPSEQNMSSLKACFDQIADKMDELASR